MTSSGKAVVTLPTDKQMLTSASSTLEVAISRTGLRVFIPAETSFMRGARATIRHGETTS